jgi:PAS domain S-box-containing protein
MMLDQELFQLFEATSDATFTVSDQGEICSWNKAAEKLFGYSRAEALRKTCYNLLQGRGTLGARVCGEMCSIRDCAARHMDVPNYDLEVRTRSGRRIWVSVSTLVYENPRNHRRLIVHLTHDITARRRNEEMLRKVTALSRQLIAIPEVIGQPAPASPLSDQEKEILRMFSVGRNSTEIAGRLEITLQTLRNHLHHINQKLHTHTRLEAVTHAIQRKLI